MTGDNPVDAKLTTGAIFKINSTSLYVPVVTFSINDNINFFRKHKARIQKYNFLE